MDKVKVAAEHKNAEGGLLAVKALAETKHSAAEAYVVAMLPILMDKYADKVLDCPYPNWHSSIITLLDVAADAACDFDGPFTVFYGIRGWNPLQKWSTHI